MLKNKRVSVVLAAHNGERYIGPQISSILSQLEENDELIVSVDPSEDRTVSVIQGFQDSRIRMLQGPGQGIVKNFEHGLMASSGDFIFLADQDDVWQPDKVQTVLDVLKQDETLLVLHDCRMTDDALHELEPSYFRWHRTRGGFWTNILRNSYIGCCMAFRRSLLSEALPFPDSLPMHDQWLGLTAARSGSVVLMYRQLMDYRRHQHNQSSLHHASLPQMLRWRLQLIRALRERKLL
ncbi:glycosyltransferase family 2 protein [Faecalibaculum rodentium]|jgi:glycosyltransferase involved in cell wall biosynthesis|uniref:glycosyltransferase family 2 protein n=2 Tax=Faecalibaculum rodentium TaxID=1702221 RepID=UPI0023F0D220|nr:glycosyltransferase family 2 protein [Faecalibaculum rodentium]